MMNRMLGRSVDAADPAVFDCAATGTTLAAVSMAVVVSAPRLCARSFDFIASHLQVAFGIRGGQSLPTCEAPCHSPPSPAEAFRTGGSFDSNFGRAETEENRALLKHSLDYSHGLDYLRPCLIKVTRST